MTAPRPSAAASGRREFLKGAAAAAGILSASGAAAGEARSMLPPPPPPPGRDDGWQLTYTRTDPATKYRCPWIEGYMSKTSVRPGEPVELMVSANPPGPFRASIFRMGHEGGTGGRLMATFPRLEGKTQPDPPIGPNRRRECEWTPSAIFTVPADWPSGVYLVKLSLLDSRWESYAVFIVRPPAGGPPEILFQCSTNTWQAYNRWPGQFSLYDDGKSEWALKAGVDVSFDRPYGKYCQILDAPLSQGSGEFLLWEFPLAHWLEMEGWKPGYVSNEDVHADPDIFRGVKLFLSVGHDEYWSPEQYRRVKEAIDGGMNAAFLSGNSVCFVSPFSPNSRGTPGRTLTRAGRFGGLSEKERAAMGPFPLEGPNEALLMGARTTSPFNGSGDWICAKPEHWLFEGTGMKRGDAIPGLIGWEFHGEPADLPGLEIVAEGRAENAAGESAHWTSTIYPGPKGNLVFNAATIWWAQGLSSPPGHILPYSHFGRPHGPDRRVQTITRNFLRRCLG